MNTFEVAILPIHIPSGNVWPLGLSIYERNGVVLYYDSYANHMSDYVHSYIESAINNITAGAHQNPVIIEVSENDLNIQTDGVNCGFHVVLNAESYLLNNGVTFLDHFNIDTERARILEILSGYLPNRNVQYIPRLYEDNDVIDSHPNNVEKPSFLPQLGAKESQEIH
uniref:Ubiquitin-like protease family profile domain-containing protein n=1 Tax=Ditylenchus dipsaci TaxID=166011 RepID=A0A915EAA8_9BILA